MIYRENYWFISKTIDFCENFTESKMTRITFYTWRPKTSALSSIIKILVFWPRKMAKLFKPLNSYKMKTRNMFIIFLVNDSQTIPPPSLQKRKFGIIADSYSTPSKTSRKNVSDSKNVSSFKVTRVCSSEFTLYGLFWGLFAFWGRQKRSLLLKMER